MDGSPRFGQVCIRLNGIFGDTIEPTSRMSRIQPTGSSLWASSTSIACSIVTGYDAAQTAPGCIQRPRPSLIVAAHGPQALGVAVRRGDVWSSYGGLGDVGFDDLIAITRERGDTLSAACESIGRDPATIGRSLLVPDSAVDPWGDEAAPTVAR